MTAKGLFSTLSVPAFIKGRNSMFLDGSIFTSDIFRYGVLPLLIFSARICDVTLGTIRVIFISRGLKYYAPVVGFFEILIWLVAIGQIMNNLTNVYCYLAYASGFAGGIFVGILIENKLAMGVCQIRIITHNGAEMLIADLKNAGFDLTCMDAEGIYNPVKIIFTLIKRKEIKNVVRVIKRHNPRAVYTVEDVRFISSSAFKSGSGM